MFSLCVQNGRRVLSCAAEHGEVGVVEALGEMGAVVDAFDEVGASDVGMGG